MYLSSKSVTANSEFKGSHIFTDSVGAVTPFKVGRTQSTEAFWKV